MQRDRYEQVMAENNMVVSRGHYSCGTSDPGYLQVQEEIVLLSASEASGRKERERSSI